MPKSDTDFSFRAHFTTTLRTMLVLSVGVRARVAPSKKKKKKLALCNYILVVNAFSNPNDEPWT
ncbi:hypothetical protein RchiOBHm_Chr3g0453751 [Rosa chinensis]|uniref:Uncharacterized protein n=1 Tax=Rosa chinensis TaxID=74649 RepID=A0A2P6R6P0_ROSCH|nr:hypothetical protein RchiOBHm_Chr3g0453751 [Rosa chinensis]